MANIKTDFPVKTLDGIELLAAGIELTEEILQELSRSNAASSYKFLPLMDYGRIGQDLLVFINYPPYHIIFADQGENEKLLKILEGVKLPLPVLESMDYLKKMIFRHTGIRSWFLFSLYFLQNFLCLIRKNLSAALSTAQAMILAKFAYRWRFLKNELPLRKANTNT